MRISGLLSPCEKECAEQYIYTMLFLSRLKMASFLLSGIMSIVSKTVHIFNHSDKPENDRNLLIYAFMGIYVVVTNDHILHSPEISLVISCSHLVPATTAADSPTSPVVLLMKLDQKYCPSWHMAPITHVGSLLISCLSIGHKCVRSLCR